MRKTVNSGFSMTELIIVIAIIAALTGVIAPMYLQYVEKSRESVDVQNMDAAYQMAVAVYAEHEYSQSTYYWYMDGTGSLGAAVPSSGYGKGSAADRGTTYAHACCEEGEYDPGQSYVGRYLIITFPESTDSGDQTVHVHWSE